jgi:hypothetical protein
MNRIVFYHVWKEGMEFSHHWYYTHFPLKLLVAEVLPQQVVCKNAPHIHWITFQDWEKERKQYCCIKLPSLYHVPIQGQNFFSLPKGYKVMVPVFDFDWVYYITSEDSSSSSTIQLPPSILFLENKLSNREEWIQTYLQPSWEIFHQNQTQLDLYQKRVFFGLSKVLGKWKMCQTLLPCCEWSSAIVEYDKAEISYHLHTQLPLEKRKQLFYQNLAKTSQEWIETWWEMLECSQHTSVDHVFLENRLLKKITNCEKKNQEWWKNMPLGRWVPRKIVDPVPVFYQELALVKKLSSTSFLSRKYLFSKIMSMKDASACSVFTQECIPFLKKITTMEGIEKGSLDYLHDDLDYVPSSSGLIVYPENPQWYVVNVRKVNYRILLNGSYVTVKNGQINPVYNGISKNEFYFMDRDTLQPVSPIRPMSENDLPPPREEEIAIVGLEDVRLVPDTYPSICFYGVTKSHSYSDAIRIITGKYNIERTCFQDTQVLHPPYEENACEKNWTWCGKNRFIYRWNPVEIGSVDANHKLIIDERIPSPLYFREFRGSSPVVVWKNFHFFSVHSVAQGENGRKYLHSLVVLDLFSETHKVIGATPPFCFEDVQIEYTIGMDIYKGKIIFLYSTRDSTSRYVRMPLFLLLEQLHFVDQEAEIQFQTQIMRDDLFQGEW